MTRATVIVRRVNRRLPEPVVAPVVVADPIPTNIPEKDRARFWSKVESGNETHCWVWRGRKHRQGYGWFDLGRSQVLAHRIAFTLARGRIPDGLVLDHLCRNPSCVNPAHLEPVSHRENCLRGTSPLALKARQTHCVHGHEFTPENTYHAPGAAPGHRQCLACIRIRNAARGAA